MKYPEITRTNENLNIDEKMKSCQDMSSCCDSCLFPDSVPKHIKPNNLEKSIASLSSFLLDEYPDNYSSRKSISPNTLHISVDHPNDGLHRINDNKKYEHLKSLPYDVNFPLEKEDDSTSNSLEDSFFIDPRVANKQINRDLLAVSNLSNYFPDEELDTTFQSLIGPPDPSLEPTRRNLGWQSIVEFRNHQIYQTGSYYGRSVGFQSNQLIQPCTGWNIGGPFMLTASHCNRVIRTVAKEPISHWRWGVYDRGFPLKSRSDPLRDDEGKRVTRHVVGRTETADRFEDLGLGRQNAPVRFSCRFRDTETPAPLPDPPSWPLEKIDIDYMTCEREKVRFTVGSELHRQETFVLPVHIFDAIPLFGPNSPERYITKGRFNYLLSSNQPQFFIHGRRHVMLSSGGIITDVNNRWDRFESELSARPGSSGGAFVDEETNLAFGVASNANVQTPGPGQKIRGYFIQPKTYKYSNPNSWPLVIEGDLQGTPRYTQTAGNQSISKANLFLSTCPKNYAAAGVIGSTIEEKISASSNEVNKSLGNFGLVCLPINKARNYQFEHAIVISNSSFDAQWIGAIKAGKPPITGYHRFDTYINRYLSAGKMPSFKEPPIRKPQSFAMCAPGYYLRGLIVSERNFPVPINRVEKRVEQVLLLVCSHWEKLYPDYIRSPRQNIGGSHPRGLLGTSSVQQTPGAALRTLSCPQGYFVDGLQSNPLNFNTKSIQLRCREASWAG